MIRGRIQPARSGKSSRKGIRRGSVWLDLTPQFPAETPHGVDSFEQECYIGWRSGKSIVAMPSRLERMESSLPREHRHAMCRDKEDGITAQRDLGW